MSSCLSRPDCRGQNNTCVFTLKTMTSSCFDDLKSSVQKKKKAHPPLFLLITPCVDAASFTCADCNPLMNEQTLHLCCVLLEGGRQLGKKRGSQVSSPTTRGLVMNCMWRSMKRQNFSLFFQLLAKTHVWTPYHKYLQSVISNGSFVFATPWFSSQFILSSLLGFCYHVLYFLFILYPTQQMDHFPNLIYFAYPSVTEPTASIWKNWSFFFLFFKKANWINKGNWTTLLSITFQTDQSIFLFTAN